jgi:hypothetical protein
MANIRLKKLTIEPTVTESPSPLIIQNGDVNITNTTKSLSILSGSLITDGGVGINADYESISSSAGGALTVGGGVGIMKSIIIGKNLSLDSSNGLIQIGGLTERRLFLDTVINKQFWISPDGVNKRLYLSDTQLNINITTNSINSSTGALTVLGGIGINSTETASNGSNGGALTVAGGVAIGKDLHVSNTVYVGTTYSNNTGLKIRYTGIDQLLLQNSSGSYSSSINMIDNDLYISNNNDIIVQSSIGNIKIKNTTNLLTVYSDKSNFSKPLSISDITSSINPTTGCLTLQGGQSINCVTDSTSVSSGGSFTTLGGVGIAKKTFTGDSIGIDIKNTDKPNKLVFYQTDYNLTNTSLFTGLGNTNGASLIYNVATNLDDHIFYSGFNKELFKIKGSNEVVFTGSSQSYSVKAGGIDSNSLSFQGNLPGSPFSFNYFSADGNDDNNLKIFGSGLYTDVTNSEFLKIGWDSNVEKYIISSNTTGSGVIRDIILQSGTLNQINIKNDGSTIFNSSIDAINSSTGTVILQNGGLAINSVINSANVSNGGALTVAGGASIAKDVFIGGDLTFNADSLSQIRTTTILSESNSYSSLQIFGSNNKYPSVHLVADPLVNTTQHPFNFKLFSLGTIDSSNYESFCMSTLDETDGYAIYSKTDGNGIKKYISLYSDNNFYQLTLQTSGNIGINTSNPNYNLDVNGTLNCNNILSVTNTLESSNSSSGSFVIDGGISISNSTEAISSTQGGSFTSAGGVGIEKELMVGGVSIFENTTPSNSSSEAAFIVKGGISIQCTQESVTIGNGGALTVVGGGSFGGDLYVGGSINGSSSTYAYLTLTTTEEAINLSSGSLITFGGITTRCSTNATSVTNGGALLIHGGASIGKDIYIGGHSNIFKMVNYYVPSNQIINLYDTLNIKRFSLDKDTSSHNFSISRYNSLGDFVEKSLDISNSDGTITLNNSNISSSANNASLLIKGGVSISTTKSAVSLGNGGSLTIAGGASIEKNLFIGGDVVMSSTTPSNDVSTGSLLIKGGVGVSGSLSVLGNTIIVGNLTVNGQTTTIDTVNTTLKDNVFILNSGPSGTNDSGFLIERYQQDNNSGLGDVIQDSLPTQFVIPDQSGLTATQIKLTNTASPINDYYKGWWIKITSGFSSNQVRKILSYDSTTKIASISSNWFTQNPSVGDLVYLYNKPFVGLIYNETNDRFEFGSSAINPTESNVSFTDHLPVHFSSTSIVSTQPASSVSSGSVRISGGITISNTTDALSVTSGGTFLTLGGASIGKTLYVGNTLNVNNTDMTPNSGDIFKSIVFTAANNQTSFTNISGLIFDNLSCWGFDCYLTAKLVATTNMYVNFHIRGVNKNNSWEIVKTYVGDDTGIEFDITNYGQIQYTSQDYSGFTSLTFKFRAFVN